MGKIRLMKSKEQIQLEERVSEVEERVATLEGQAQEQADVKSIIQQIEKKLNSQYLKSSIPENSFRD